MAKYFMLPNTGAHQLADLRIIRSGSQGCYVESDDDLATLFPEKFRSTEQDLNQSIPEYKEGEKPVEVDPNDVTAQFKKTPSELPNVKVFKSGRKFKVSVDNKLDPEELTKVQVVNRLDELRDAEADE